MVKTKGTRLFIFTFLVIPVLHLLIFSYIPIITNIYLSFTNYNGVNPPKWVGFRNYERIFTDPQYLKLFRNCLWYMVVAIPQLVFAFILAVFVNGKFRGINFFKGVLIVPYLLNGVIISTIFIIYFNNNGTLNSILRAVGLGKLAQQWLHNLRLVNPAIASISIWRYYGLNFLMFFGGLQAIPHELYEAAAIDGCTKLQEIRYISVPSVLHILFINILLSISGSIQVFEIPYIMLNGANGTATPVIQIQQSAFAENRVGFAAALSIVVFVVVVIAVSLQRLLARRGSIY
ncbi:ABC-type transporter, integral membrane subunit [Thermoclostridium stercorarium subsp. stercorarium DSM 8532]|jgi:multiple sugar transport system permease protein|uniref:ABC-type transporter, integral membrane subunit n=3 Tax=Thermoclostridium stercorarium TaxID=1510 RepID=L7VHH2_THES1|nr:sugar ABC transporter permease [Thermoclostridium stercorarium]AGC67490.1 ABC-type transporter, integral membrane subunit [Thermoclostridium stercorarium subsp. stercorarium DSM 8532]AGI38545.1 ABC transporter permease subunit [Thermoclostridium stercorarium subsp. stercorarium DSM 8532]ANW97918.1 ABC transporter permease [Thermoclostridium stercorarium subsp. thermolacticum DSM 2910]ANX00468.1 ABC transporter permease [Thermoclostridium stercorarium subsp. leptospartum DSM 9219]UZQ86074.1 